MAEADERLSDFAGLGAGLQDDRTTDWLMLARHDDDHLGHEMMAESWETCAAVTPSFPVRWTWKYRPTPLSLNGNGAGVQGVHDRRKKVNVLVVGDGPLGDRIVAELERVNGYALVGHLH